MPLFIKAGSIIPVGPKVQFAMQVVKDPLKILVYPGANGSFELYEDEGETYHYEKGTYSKILISWDDQARTLTLGEREGTFKGMLNKRVFKMIVIGEESGYTLDQNVGISINYDGRKQVIKD
jgi:alpha-D-xyloside xylohydrolase